MPRIAISGHRGLPDGTVRLVDAAIRAALDQTTPDVVGLSCLADGADQIFARAVVDYGGAIEVIVPAAEYRIGLPRSAHDEYDALLNRATAVHRLPHVQSNSEAHMAASAFMLDHSDELWAVWDGRPARGHDGTADVVAYAREQRRPVRVIWPDGAVRD